MATTTTPTPAAALANPGGYSIRIPFTAAGAYDLELTKAAAMLVADAFNIETEAE
jgi:hypothetical protein